MWKSLAALVVFLVAHGVVPAGHGQNPVHSSLSRSFSEWGDFLAGGVWTGTRGQGHAHEQTWEWVLDRAFLQVRWKVSGDTGMSLVGIDPATGKLAWWGFDHDGRVWKGTTSLDRPGEWRDEGTGDGPSGHNAWKATLTRPGPDEVRIRIDENVVDGKAFPPEVIVLRRKK
jgi:hypothetical protein